LQHKSICHERALEYCHENPFELLVKQIASLPGVFSQLRINAPSFIR